MDASGSSTQQLAEFVAAVSAAQTEAAAARLCVERAAEALDAEVTAIISGTRVLAALGYPEGAAPVEDLARVRPGVAGSELTVPGVGACPAAAFALTHAPGATLVIARPAPLTRAETGLLRGIASVSSTTLRLLRALDDERDAREEIERLAREQTALRRVATLVARGVAPEQVFSAVTEEVGRVFGADAAVLSRYDRDGEHRATVVGAWTATGVAPPRGVGERVDFDGTQVTGIVFRDRASARIDRTEDEFGVRTSVGAPVVVAGQLWGAIVVRSTQTEPLPGGAEARLAGFTELIATAVANAEARAQLRASRARIVATADATRRRIERNLHDGAQQRLVAVTLSLRGAQDEVPPDATVLAGHLDKAIDELVAAVDDLREFARGIHPAALVEGGLRPALNTLARRSALPVELDVRVERRLSEPVELAAYYVVAEALTNAAKHAQASAVWVEAELRNDAARSGAPVLQLRVADDGRGGADLAGGSGLVGLMDRVEALGGRMTLDSPPGAGTTLQIALPLSAGLHTSQEQRGPHEAAAFQDGAG
jgi:signal transduction histidine kinase